MADQLSLYGFRYFKGRNDHMPLPERARVASAYQGTSNAINVDLNVGDPVKKVSDGTVALCATGDATYGVIVGIEQYYDGTKIIKPAQRLPGASTYGTVIERTSILLIQPVAGVLFECDCDDKTSITTEANYIAAIGENVDASFNGVAGSTLANPRLDISTHAVTNTLVWRVVDLAPNPKNQDYAGSFVKLIVTCNLVQQAPWTILGV